jgi:hypothetical protein
MKHFKKIETLENLKKEYRELAKQFHPDKIGGNLQIMQEINNEYDFLSAKILSGQNFTADEIEAEFLNNEIFKQKISELINCEGLIIEVVGSWLWVTGDTYQHKTVLKNSGFFFAPKKLAWYFRTDENKTHRGGKLSLEQIKSKYGSTGVKNKFSKKIN